MYPRRSTGEAHRRRATGRRTCARGDVAQGRRRSASEQGERARLDAPPEDLFTARLREVCNEDSADCYVRAGVHSTRDEGLAQRVRVLVSAAQDLDGDGQTDEVLAVEHSFSWLRDRSSDACVAAIHRQDGWRLSVLRIHAVDVAPGHCAVVVSIAGREFLVTRDGSGYEADDAARVWDNGFTFHVVEADGRVREAGSGFAEKTQGQAELMFQPSADGIAIAVTDASGWAQEQRWDAAAARLVPGPWTPVGQRH